MVTGTANRPIGKHDLTVQSPELNPKNAVRLVSVREDTLPPLQPSIDRKNDTPPKVAAWGGLLVDVPGLQAPSDTRGVAPRVA